MMREQLPQGLENLIQSIGDMPIPENGEADISIKIRGNDVMERPMFAAGGGANKFPDLSGDGQVTQKDILMGRGVIQKQAGGPIPDMPMQAQAAPPAEEVRQLEQVEQQAQAEGEQVGLEYLAQTMDGMDAAEDVEEMINAMRGNEMPLEARRMELAEFVGRDDAMATPETVLAMVQPTIMLSEEGAMNTGIGDLMRQMTEDVNMATEGGAPTDMGEGLGGLMMAGAPMPQEPVQGFAQGGAVKKFSNGGKVAHLQLGSGPFGTLNPLSLIQGYEDTDLFSDLTPIDRKKLAEMYPERLALYKEIIGDKDTERQRGFDLAQAGFALASGVDPSTGRNIAGRPFLSQVGAALTPFAKSQSERLAEERKTERALALAAMQATEKEASDLRKQTAERGTQLLSAQIAAGQQLTGIDADFMKLDKIQEFTRGENQLDRRHNILQQKDRQQFQEKILGLTQAQEEKMKRLGGEIQSALSAQNFTQSGKLQNQAYMESRGLLDLRHENNLAEALQDFDFKSTLQADRYAREGGLIKIRGGVQQALQDSAQQHAKVMQDDKQDFLANESAYERDLREDLAEDANNLKRRYVDLAEEEFVYKQKLGPSVKDERSWWARFAGQPEKTQAARLQDIFEERKALENQMISSGIELDEFKARSSAFLTHQGQLLQSELAKTKELSGLLERLIPADLEYGSTSEMYQLTGNPQMLRAYAEGQTIPGFESSINALYGTSRRDPATGDILTPSLPPALRSAMQARKNLGLAIPNIPGFANGGEAYLTRRPEGPFQEGTLFDPITARDVGGTMPMAAVDETEERTFDPRITADVADITLATGTREAIGGIVGGVANSIANVIFGGDASLGRDVKQAQKAVETLGTVATTTLMAAIPGKDNVELQRMLKQLQVTPGTFNVQDTEALDYFRIARNTMDLGIENQLDLQENANLTQKERTKVKEDIAQMNAIRAEYDNVIKAYETKLLPSEDVYKELDKFFR